MPLLFELSAAGLSGETAAFFRMIEDKSREQVGGALFTVTSKGYPVDFCYAAVQVSRGTLWHGVASKRRAAAELARSLFAATSATPSVLLMLSVEVPDSVFELDIRTKVPVGKVSHESGQRHGGSSAVSWIGSTPAADAPAIRLVETLAKSNMLTEPFERAGAALEQALADK